ncbi:MAG: hypothetical protein V7K65_23605 [Nostoc sp.]
MVPLEFRLSFVLKVLFVLSVGGAIAFIQRSDFFICLWFLLMTNDK